MLNPPNNGVVGFYKGIPHKLLGKIVDDTRRGKNLKVEFKVLSLWRETEEEIIDVEAGAGVTRIIRPEEFIIPAGIVPIKKEVYDNVLKKQTLFYDLLAESGKKVEGEEIARHTLTNSACAIWLKGEKEKPNVLINGLSSSGKGFVTKSVVDLLPKHLGVYMTKISPEAFTYWKADDETWTWDGKLLMLDDVSQKFINCDTFKVMLSEGSKAVIVRDGKAFEFMIKGRPLVFLTTANSVPNDELTNRMNFLQLTETEEQTRAILQRQALEASGLKEKVGYDWVLTNALSLLERREVIVPYADKLISVFPAGSVSIRRDFPRFLTLIKASAVLYQYQRKTDGKGRIIAEEQDYTIAVKSFQGFSFQGGLIKLQHNYQEAYNHVKGLLDRVVNFDDDDAKGYVTIDDVASNPLYTRKSWYRVLDDLAKKGLLIKGSKPGDFNKPKTIYKMGKDSPDLIFPSFESLKGGKIGE